MTDTSATPRTWFVTGSARGLGRHLIVAALARGEQVAATARRPDQIKDLAEAYPGQLFALPLDVTDADAANAAVAAAVQHFGRLDVVVNNAGYADLASIEDTSLADFHAQIDVNLFGVINVVKAALPVLREQGAGHLITVSSVGGRVGTPGLAAYQAAKWGVNGFTEVLATEVTPLGIKVTTVEPGGIRTEWAGASMSIPTPSEPYRQTVGLIADAFRNGSDDSLGDPAKVADAILALADLAEPPVRVLLGSDALVTAEIAAGTQAARDAQWEQLSRSTDRDDATPAQRDPLGVTAGSPETVVRRFLDEVVNGGRLELIGELWAEDLEWHGGSMGDIYGLTAFQEYLAANASGAFSDMRLTIDEVITSGDKVVVRFTNSGRHTGPFMGVAGTGAHASWLGIGVYTVRDGRITSGWFGEDVLGMLLQLGVVQLPA